MRHIVDMALKAKKKIQESEPNNIAQQLSNAFWLKPELAKLQHGDQRAGDAEDCA